MSLRVEYADVPVGPQEPATVTGASQPMGDAGGLCIGYPDTPWVTLEPGGWALDGTGVLLPDVPESIGWWSQIRSDEAGQFAQPPVLLLSFAQPISASGLTFTFWPSLCQWCSRMTVRWYGQEQLLAEITADPDNSRWVLDYPVDRFDRVEVTLLGTNLPGQFAKLQQIQIGQIRVFLSDEIIRATLLNEVDPSLCQLSVDTMTLEIRDKGNRMLSPRKNQKVQLFRNGVQIAAHYITEVSRNSRQDYQFQCQSTVGLLEEQYLGGFCEMVPAETLLADVLGGMPFSLHPAFAREELIGYLPVGTRREALQKIAFTIGAVVTTQGDGTIRLLPIADTVSGSFRQGDIFSGAKLTEKATIAGVQVTAHSYVPDDVVQTLLNEETVSGTGVLYVFSEPYHSYALTGGTLDSFGDNWVRITADGPVTLHAQKFLHTQSVWKWEDSTVAPEEKGNVLAVTDVTLVNPNNVQAILERLCAYGKNRSQLTQTVVMMDQQAGQLVESRNPWGTVTRGYLTRVESEFTATGHTGNITVEGREVKL